MATKHPRLWGLWLAGSLFGLVALAYAITHGTDKRFLMPGPMTHGHHQIALACETCHGDPYGSFVDDGEAMDEACLGCHGDLRKKPIDAHPETKFKDPRNAARLEKIDVLRCVTCHAEHKPEITHAEGYTQPVDFCVHCHADVGENRPSHAGMGFETCNSAGCHNFHDNRALYTDFLLKHRDAPEVAERPRLPKRELLSALEQIPEYPHDRYPLAELTLADADAPAESRGAAIDADWLASAHARAGVNCSACHQPAGEDAEPAPWSDRPGPAACAGCHDAETAGFERGLHGMRGPQGLAPMTPAEARLPMRPESAHQSLTCNSCHGAHAYDTRTAAVESCLGCHADGHSLAYQASPHARLWRAELAGEAAAGTGVSCASCHLPRVDFEPNDWLSRILVEHNQSVTLRPNERMIRPACLHCHGLGFAIDALADRALIDANFAGRPAAHVASIEMAVADERRAEAERAAQ